MLKTTLSICLVLALAFGGGIWSVRYVLDQFEGFNVLRIGQWTAYPALGTPDADPYAKARDARNGSLSLGIAEGLAFYSNQSNDGQTLARDCSYELSGSTLPARLWTIHAAAPDLTPLNPGEGFEAALHSLELIRDTDGRFTISIGNQARPGNWLPVNGLGPFVLVMLFYDAPVASSGSLTGLVMPTLTRLSAKGHCGG